jgi:pre-peptidase
MKHLMCGLVVLAAAAVLGSCNGDPTGDIRGQGQQIIADPTAVVVSQGAQKFVLVERRDEQGNQEAADFQVRSVAPGITVTKDLTFLPTNTTPPSTLQTRARFIVTGVDLLNSAFTVEGGGDTLRVPVTVAPVGIAPAFSTTAPTQNQPVTVTAPAGYKFMPGATITFGSDLAVVLSRAADSSSFTFVPQPLFPDPLETPPTPKFRTGTIDQVEAGYIPGVPLTLPTVDSVLIPLLDTLAGTGSTGTAPVIATPVVGESSVLFDAAGFAGADITPDGGTGAQYYQFTLTAPASVTITLNWPASSVADLDLVLCKDAACSAATADLVAAGASHPESGDYTLAAGTYYIAAVWFLGTAPPLPPDQPTRIDITITRNS